MVQILKESGSGFLVKGGLSWVDFVVAEQVLTFSGFDPETLKKYPEMLEHMKRVYDLPQIKAYVENRKKTPT